MAYRDLLQLLKPTGQLLARIFKEKNPDKIRALLLTYGLEHWVRQPVLYTDQYELRYLLYPGQNATVYFQNQGNYEVGENRYVLNTLKPGMTVVDVGANIGLYTLLFAKLVGHQGQVHSFEAEQRNYNRLCTNVRINSFKNIRLNRSAVFSESKPLQLNVFPDSVNAWHSLGRPKMDDPWNPGQPMPIETRQEVPGITLDDYADQVQLGPVDLLKIDVEGAELDVLKGAETLFTRGLVARVMFEISAAQIEGMGYQASDLFDWFRRYRFVCCPIQRDGKLGAPVDTMVAAYGNYVAIREADAHDAG